MTSGRVSRAGREELRRNAEQMTASGLVVASPDGGFRLAAFLTDIPGVFQRGEC